MYVLAVRARSGQLSLQRHKQCHTRRKEASLFGGETRLEANIAAIGQNEDSGGEKAGWRLKHLLAILLYRSVSLSLSLSLYICISSTSFKQGNYFKSSYTYYYPNLTFYIFIQNIQHKQLYPHCLKQTP